MVTKKMAVIMMRFEKTVVIGKMREEVELRGKER
jgi:hypothetical protein